MVADGPNGKVANRSTCPRRSHGVTPTVLASTPLRPYSGRRPSDTSGVGAVVVGESGVREVTQADAEPADRSDLPGDVLQAFCRGDVNALSAVFDRYSRPVWSVAMSVLSNRQLADDATQETFLRAWKAADRFDHSRPLAPWLLTIARRTALDVIRRENRPTRGGHEQEQDQVVHAPGIERAWETWEIRQALDQLPDEERQVMFLAHFKGMSHPQIATELGIPTGTVKSRSYRAHKRLASLLQHVVAAQGGV